MCEGVGRFCRGIVVDSEVSGLAMVSAKVFEPLESIAEQFDETESCGSLETYDAYESVANKFTDGYADVDKDDTKEEMDLNFDLEVMNGTGSELVWKHELSLLGDM